MFTESSAIHASLIWLKQNYRCLMFYLKFFFIFKLSAGVKWVLYDGVIGFNLNGWTKRNVLIIKILLISLGEFQ